MDSSLAAPPKNWQTPGVERFATALASLGGRTGAESSGEASALSVSRGATGEEALVRCLQLVTDAGRHAHGLVGLEPRELVAIALVVVSIPVVVASLFSMFSMATTRGPGCAARRRRDSHRAAQCGTNRRKLPVHDLRATFATLSLANGKTETWVADPTGHRTGQMISRYRSAAGSATELELGARRRDTRAA
ncbi:MAG: putative integrase/recombinase [Polyangiaceae bacterium]|jgi:hypothetical protein|nr:putative integrase/recombinase [Polyangiaceae bacterium]